MTNKNLCVLETPEGNCTVLSLYVLKMALKLKQVTLNKRFSYFYILNFRMSLFLCN